MIGNDLEGVAHGYKLHIFYNLMANPSNTVYGSISNVASPIEFSWALSSIPLEVSGRRATAHFSIDSTKVEPYTIGAIENILYGNSEAEPTLPDFQYLLAILIASDFIAIIDNGDGTWTANGPDELITMLDSTTFQIDGANATYLDDDTYTISTTES
jgi:hypothetical protein